MLLFGEFSSRATRLSLDRRIDPGFIEQTRSRASSHRDRRDFSLMLRIDEEPLETALCYSLSVNTG